MKILYNSNVHLFNIHLYHLKYTKIKLLETLILNLDIIYFKNIGVLNS